VQQFTNALSLGEMTDHTVSGSCHPRWLDSRSENASGAETFDDFAGGTPHGELTEFFDTAMQKG
jgi:hypothetical protein